MPDRATSQRSQTASHEVARTLSGGSGLWHSSECSLTDEHNLAQLGPLPVKVDPCIGNDVMILLPSLTMASWVDTTSRTEDPVLRNTKGKTAVANEIARVNPHQLQSL